MESCGGAGFTPGTAAAPSLTLDDSGTPYVAYRDGTNGGKATVMKYDQGEWTSVGEAGFTPGAGHVPSLVLDDSGTPYVAYRDGGNSNRISVMSFEQVNTLSFESNGGTAVNSVKVRINETVSEPVAPTRTGYAFAGWYTDGELTQTYDFTSLVTRDLTLYAKWEANDYTVSFESNGGTAVNSETANYNETVSEPVAPTRIGYAFAGWYTDDELTQIYDFTSPVIGNLIPKEKNICKSRFITILEI